MQAAKEEAAPRAENDAQFSSISELENALDVPTNSKLCSSSLCQPCSFPPGSLHSRPSFTRRYRQESGRRRTTRARLRPGQTSPLQVPVDMLGGYPRSAEGAPGTLYSAAWPSSSFLRGI